MIFYSPYTAFAVLVRSEEEIIHHTPKGTVVQKVRPLVADFATHGGTFRYIDPLTGEEHEGAHIRGHYFDSESAAQQEKWTEEEKKLVETVLLELCETQPQFIQVWKPPAPSPPWSTYDNTPADRVPALAEELGLAREALAYEEATRNRPSVVNRLRKAVERQAVHEALAEEQ